jgi:hypothetical protein
LNKHPKVGYAFCPAVGVINGTENGLLEWSTYGSRDRIVDGHILLKKLLRINIIAAASGMARRECYEKISFFPLNVVWAGVPLDLVWGGDWYLWCLFALYFDVGYFAEPMVCYREHDHSMTSILMQGNVEKCSAPDVAVPWMIRRKADEAGWRSVSRSCLGAAANEYARSIGSLMRYGTCKWSMTLEQFEESLRRNDANDQEKKLVRARVHAGIGDQYYWRGELALAKQFYLAGLRRDPWMPKVLGKCLLLLLGNQGAYLRRSFRALRQNEMIARSSPSDSQSA